MNTPQELYDCQQENAKLQDKIIILEAKERELRALISYLNKLGPKPENMNP